MMYVCMHKSTRGELNRVEQFCIQSCLATGQFRTSRFAIPMFLPLRVRQAIVLTLSTISFLRQL